MALKCLCCGIELTEEEVTSPCFIQMCKGCLNEVDWGGKKDE